MRATMARSVSLNGFYKEFKEHTQSDQRIFSEIKSDLREIKSIVAKTHELLQVQAQRVSEHERRLNENDNTNRNLGIGLFVALITAVLGFFLRKS